MPPASAPSGADEEERRRLRAKLSELKQLVAERNEERSVLRRQLVKMHETFAAMEQTTEHTADPGEKALEDHLDGAAVEPSHTLLIPHYAASGEESLRKLPSALCRKSLAVITSLASLESAAWRQVKQLVTASPPLLSCRIGLRHRALFRIEDGHLTVLSIFHRKDLDTVVKRYG